MGEGCGKGRKAKCGAPPLMVGMACRVFALLLRYQRLRKLASERRYCTGI